LTEAERDFLKNEIDEVCRLVNDWQAAQTLYDTPPEA